MDNYSVGNRFYQTKSFRRVLAVLLAVALLFNNILENSSYLFAGEEITQQMLAPETAAVPDALPPPADAPETKLVDEAQTPDEGNLLVPGAPTAAPTELAAVPGEPTATATEPVVESTPVSEATPVAEATPIVEPTEGPAPESTQAPESTEAPVLAPQNAAEDPNFSDGYAVVLAKSALLYRKPKEDEKTTVLQVLEDEVVLAHGRFIDPNEMVWIEVRAIDADGARVDGWIDGRLIVPMPGDELARRTNEAQKEALQDFVTLDENGVPHVACAKIVHETQVDKGAKPTEEPADTELKAAEDQNEIDALEGTGASIVPFGPGSDPAFDDFLEVLSKHIPFFASTAGSPVWDNGNDTFLIQVNIAARRLVIDGNALSALYDNFDGQAVHITVKLPPNSPLMFMSGSNYSVDSTGRTLTFDIHIATPVLTGDELIQSLPINLVYDYAQHAAVAPGTIITGTVEIDATAHMGYFKDGERILETEARPMHTENSFDIEIGERTYVDAGWDLEAITCNTGIAGANATVAFHTEAFLRDKATGGAKVDTLDWYRTIIARADLEYMRLTIQIPPLRIVGASEANQNVYPASVAITNSGMQLTQAVDGQGVPIPGAYILPMVTELIGGKNLPVYTNHKIELTYALADLRVPFYQFDAALKFEGEVEAALDWKLTGNGSTAHSVKRTGTFGLAPVKVAGVAVQMNKYIEANGAQPVAWDASAQVQYPGTAKLGLRKSGEQVSTNLYTLSGSSYVLAGTEFSAKTPTGQTGIYYVLPGKYLVYETGTINGFTQKNPAQEYTVPENFAGTMAIDVINSNGGITVTKKWEINGDATTPQPDAVTFTLYTDANCTQIANMVVDGVTVPAVLTTAPSNPSVTFSVNPPSYPADYWVKETHPDPVDSWFDREAPKKVTIASAGQLVSVDFLNSIAAITVNIPLEIGGAHSIYYYDNAMQTARPLVADNGELPEEMITLTIGGKTYLPRRVDSVGNPYIDNDANMTFFVPKSIFDGASSYDVSVHAAVPGFGKETTYTTLRVGTLPKASAARFYMGVVEVSKKLRYNYSATQTLDAVYTPAAAAVIGDPAIWAGLTKSGVQVQNVTLLNKNSTGKRYVLDNTAGLVDANGRVKLHQTASNEMLAVIGVPINSAQSAYTVYESFAAADFWQLDVSPATGAVTLATTTEQQRAVLAEFVNQPKKYGALVIEKHVSQGGETLAAANFHRIQSLSAVDSAFNPSYKITVPLGRTDTAYLAYKDTANNLLALFLHVPMGETVTVQENTTGLAGYVPVAGESDPANWLTSQETTMVDMPSVGAAQQAMFGTGKVYNIKSAAVITLTKQILKLNAATPVDRAANEGVFTYNVYRIAPGAGTGIAQTKLNDGSTVYYYTASDGTFVFTGNAAPTHQITKIINMPSGVVTADYVLIESAATPASTYEIALPQKVTLTKGTMTPVQVTSVNKEWAQLIVSSQQFALNHVTSTDPHSNSHFSGVAFPTSAGTLTYRIQGTAADGTAINTTFSNTNPNGMATIRVPSGTYTVTVATMPAGYRRLDVADNDLPLSGSMSVTLAPAVTVNKTVKLENPNGFVDLKKVDKNGNPLSGAVFALKQGSTTVKTVTSTASGDVVFTGVAPGVYTLVETAAPNGYYAPQAPISVTVTGGRLVGGSYVAPEDEGQNCHDNNPALVIQNIKYTEFTMTKYTVTNGVQALSANLYATIVVADGAGGYTPFDYAAFNAIFYNGANTTARVQTASGKATWRLPAGTYYIFEENLTGTYPDMGDKQTPAVTTRVPATVGGKNGWVLGPYAISDADATKPVTLRNLNNTLAQVDLFSFSNFFAGTGTVDADWLNNGTYRLVNVATPASTYASTKGTVSGKGMHYFTNVPIFDASGNPIAYRVEVVTAHEGYFAKNALGSAVHPVALTDANGHILAAGSTAYKPSPASPTVVDYQGKTRQQPTDATYAYAGAFTLYDVLQLTAGGNNTRPHVSIQNERKGEIVVPVTGEDCLRHGVTYPLAGVKVGLYDLTGKQLAVATTDASGNAVFTGADGGLYLAAEQDYIVVQLEEHTDHVLNTCTDIRVLPANPAQLTPAELSGIVSGNNPLNAVLVRSKAFEPGGLFYVANTAPLTNHKPYVRIEMTKDSVWTDQNYDATRRDMERFVLYEVGYDFSTDAVTAAKVEEYTSGMLNGEHGKFVTSPLTYGKMYVLVEQGTSNPAAIHVVMPADMLTALKAQKALTTAKASSLPGGNQFDDALRTARDQVVSPATNLFASAMLTKFTALMGYTLNEMFIETYSTQDMGDGQPVQTFADNYHGNGGGGGGWHIGRVLLHKRYIDAQGVERDMNGVTFSFSLVHINEDGSVHHTSGGQEDLTWVANKTSAQRTVDGVVYQGVADSGSFFLHDWKVYPLGPSGQENYYYFVRQGSSYFGVGGASLNILKGAFDVADKAQLFTTLADAQTYAAATGGGAVAELAHTMPHSASRAHDHGQHDPAQNPHCDCANTPVRVRIEEIGGAAGMVPLTPILDVDVMCQPQSTDETAQINTDYFVQPIVNGDPNEKTYFILSKFGYQPTSISADAWSKIKAAYPTDAYAQVDAFGRWLAGKLTAAEVPGIPSLSGSFPVPLPGVQFKLVKKDGPNAYSFVQDAGNNDIVLTTNSVGMVASPVLETGVEYYLSEIVGGVGYINAHNAGATSITDANKLIRVGILTQADVGKTVYVSNARKIDLIVHGIDSYNRGTPSLIVIPGVTYTLYASNASGTQGAAIGTKVAGADGQATFENLDVGYYLMVASNWDATKWYGFHAVNKDANLPDSIATLVNAATFAKAILYVPGGVQNMTSKSDEMHINVYYPPLSKAGVIKVDAMRTTTYLPGVSYKLYKYVSGTTYNEIEGALTTDANGRILFTTPLQDGRYRIDETGAPAHLMLPTAPVTVAYFKVTTTSTTSFGVVQNTDANGTVNSTISVSGAKETVSSVSNQVYRLTLKNDRKLRVQLQKTGLDAGATANLPNVQFSVKKNGAAYKTPTLTTDAAGVATLDLDEYGTYTFEETAGASGYIRLSGILTITFNAGQAPTISATGDWKDYGYITTPAVTLDGSTGLNQYAVQIKNPAPFAITAKKVDGLDQPLAGARFGLYTDAAYTLQVPSTEGDGFYSTTLVGGEYVLNIGGLLPGRTYYLQEEVVPAGHTRMTNLVITSAASDAGTTKTIGTGGKLINYQQSGLHIDKHVNWATTEPMDGSDFALPKILFNIYEATGSANETKGKLAVGNVEAVRTGVGTYATVTPVILAPGHYIVEEITTATTTGDPLIIDTNPIYDQPFNGRMWKVQIHQQGAQNVITKLSIGNAELYASLNVLKVYDAKPGPKQPLPGTEFKLYTLKNPSLTGSARYAPANQQSIPGLAALYVADSQGKMQIQIPMTTASMLVVIEETKPAAGYLIQESSRYTDVTIYAGAAEVTVGSNTQRQAEVEITNGMAGTLILDDAVLTQYSGVTPLYDGDHPLSGVTYTLYMRKSSAEDFVPVSGLDLGAATSPARQTTDASGRIVWENLPIDRQYAVTINPAEDYVFHSLHNAATAADFGGAAIHMTQLDAVEDYDTGLRGKPELFLLMPDTMAEAAANTLYYKAYHEQKGSITIKKYVDNVGDFAQTPVTFMLYEGVRDGSNNIVKKVPLTPAEFPYSGTQVVQGKITFTGQAVIHQVNPGLYVVEETVAPAGYMLTSQSFGIEIKLNTADPKDTSGLHKLVEVLDIAYAANPAAIRKTAAPDAVAQSLMRHNPANPNEVIAEVDYTLDTFMAKYSGATETYTPATNPFPYETFVVTDKGLGFSAVAGDFANAANQLAYADYVRFQYQFTSLKVGKATYKDGANAEVAASAKVQYLLFQAGDSQSLPTTWMDLPGTLLLDIDRTVTLPANTRAFRVVYERPGIGFVPGPIAVRAQFFVQPDGKIGGATLRRQVRGARNEASIEASFYGVDAQGPQTTVTELAMDAKADITFAPLTPPAQMEIFKRVTVLNGEPYKEIVNPDNLERQPVPVFRGTQLTYTISLTNRSLNGAGMPDPILIDRLPEDFHLNVASIKMLVAQTEGNNDYTTPTLGNSVLSMGTPTQELGRDLRIGDGSRSDADANKDTYVMIPFTGNLLPGETLLVVLEGTIPVDMSAAADVIEFNDALATTKVGGLVYDEQPEGYVFFDYGNSGDPADNASDWYQAVEELFGPGLHGVIRDLSRYKIDPLSQMFSSKYVKGDDGGSFSNTMVAYSHVGGSVQYRLLLSMLNATGGASLNTLRIADVLPQLGDANRTNMPAGQSTTWMPLLDTIQVTFPTPPQGQPEPDLSLVLRVRPVGGADDYADVASKAEAYLKGAADLGATSLSIPANNGKNAWVGIDAYLEAIGYTAVAFGLSYPDGTPVVQPSEVLVQVTCKVPSINAAKAATDPARYWTQAKAMENYYTRAYNNAKFNYRFGTSWVGQTSNFSTVADELLPRESQIGNLIWLDINSNGIQDAGEPGIQDVRVTLIDYQLKQSASVWTPTQVQTATEVTKAATVIAPAGIDHGTLQNFTFKGMPYKTTTTGTPYNDRQHWYEVEVEVPTGFTVSGLRQGADRSLDSNLQSIAAKHYLTPDDYQASAVNTRYIKLLPTGGDYMDDLRFDGGLNVLYDVAIKKTDAKGTPLPGATFGLFEADAGGQPQGAALESKVSAGDGGVTFTGLSRFRSYAIQELSAPTYYAPSTKVLSLAGITWSGNNVSLSEIEGKVAQHKTDVAGALANGNDTFVNTVATGALTIQKQKTDQTPLAGAEFVVTNTATFIAGAWQEFLHSVMPAHVVADIPGNRIIVTIPASGEATIIGLPYGIYTVTETKAPSGYAIGDTAAHPKSATVKIGDPADPTMADHALTVVKTFVDPKITLKVKKVDDQGIGLAGAEFALYDKAAYDANPATAVKLFTLVTDAQGYASLKAGELLAVGDYYLVETKAPQSYMLVKIQHAFTVTATQTEYAIHFTGEQQTQNGMFDIGHPAIVNELTLGTLRINKWDTGKTSPLGGAEFIVTPNQLKVSASWALYLDALRAGTMPAGLRIVGANDPNGYPKDSLHVTLPAGGTLDITGIPTGTYDVTEVVAPEGYAIANPAKQTITVSPALGAHALDAADFEDPRVVVTIEKFDPSGNTPLPGAVFGIFTQAQYQSGPLNTSTAFEALTTDSQGKAASSKLLPPGDYYLVELSAPAGYVASFNATAFTVNNKTQKTVYNFTKTKMTGPDAAALEQYFGAIKNDTEVGALEIRKADQENPSSLLGGAEFIVENQGTIAASGAWAYFLANYVPPAGVTVQTQGGTQVLHVLLPATGHITLAGLPTGRYAVTEIKAPKGYAIASPAAQDVDVTASVNGSANPVTFLNPRVRLEIEKKSELGGPLSGVVFGIFAQADYSAANLDPAKALYTLITDAQGKASTGTAQKLDPGTYYLVELSAPVGYGISFVDEAFVVDNQTQVYRFTFTKAATEPANLEDHRGEIINYLAKTGLTIYKLNAEDKQGPKLEGAAFILKNLSTTVAGAWDSYWNSFVSTPSVIKETQGSDNVLRIKLLPGSGGMLTLDDIPMGSYEVTEVLAPVGYAVANPKTQRANTQSGGATAVFEDERVRVEIEKVREDGTGLPGVTFVIMTDAEYQGTKSPLFTLTTGTDGKAGTDKTQLLPPGTYWLVEHAAPAGYDILHPDTQFVVDNTAQTYRYNFTATPMNHPDSAALEQFFGKITNDFSKGSLTIEKTDQELGALLAGAEFIVRPTTGVVQEAWAYYLGQVPANDPERQVVTQGTNKLLKVTLGITGQITLTGLPVGRYDVTETKAPDGYALPVVPTQAVEMNKSATAHVIFEDLRVRVEIEKMDAADQPLKDVVFAIIPAAAYNPQTPGKGQALYVLTTDAQGMAGTTAQQPLPPGTYWLVERSAPTGYAISFADYQFVVDPTQPLYRFNFTASGSSSAQEVHKGRIVNQFAKASLTIIKEDAHTGDKLAGAQFIVQNTGNSAPNAWDDYLAQLSNPQVGIETMGADRVLRVTLSPASGGTITLTGMPLGKYEITEVVSPLGYTLDGGNNPQTIELVEGQIQVPVARFQNNRIRVEIQKKDENQNDLAGAQFGIFTDLGGSYNPNGLRYTLTTDGGGRAATAKDQLLADGTYWLVELSAPLGYEKNFAPAQFVVDKATQVYRFNFTDVPGNASETDNRSAIGNLFARGKLTIQKQNHGSVLLEGAEFIVQPLQLVASGAWQRFGQEIHASGSPSLRMIGAGDPNGYPQDSLHVTLTAGTGGTITIGDLPWGVYEVHEVKAPQGYALSDTAKRKVFLGDPASVLGAAYTLHGTQTFSNQYVRVAVEKRNELGNALDGAEFAIFEDAYYQNHTPNLDPAFAKANMTTVNGMAETTETDAKQLVPGTYWLVETKAPLFHTLTFAPVSFTVSRTQTGWVFNFTATPTAQDVPGYAGKEAIRNQTKTGELALTKTDSETGASLQGVTFRMRKVGTMVPGAWERFLADIGTSQSGVSVESTGANGTLLLTIQAPAVGLTVTHLPWGEYALTELTPPAGYALSTPREKTVRIGDPLEAGDPAYQEKAALAFENPRIRLRLNKVSEGGYALSGAEFTIYDAQGKAVHVLPLTDQNGYTETTADQLLLPGTYRLVETKTPAKHSVYPHPIFFTVSDAQSEWVYNLTGIPVQGEVTGAFAGVEVPLSDPYGRGAIEIQKVDSALQTGAYGKLPGAVFRIENVNTQEPGLWADLLAEMQVKPQQNVQVVGSALEITTDWNGKAAVQSLPWGIYTVQEVKAPAGYILSDPTPRTLYVGDPSDIDLSRTGDPYRLVCREVWKDVRIQVVIQKVNQFDNPVQGAVFLLSRTDGKTDLYAPEFLTTDKDGRAESMAWLLPGEYRLVETQTAKYHNVKFQPVTFTVSEGQTKGIYDFTWAKDDPAFALDEIAIINEAESGSVSVHKIDAVTGKNLSGSVFRLRQISPRVPSMKLHKDLFVTTDYYGMATFTEVPYGYYELTETRAPIGYAAATKTRYVTVSRTQRDERYTNTNEPIMGSIQVYKVDGETLTPLEGAKFTLSGTGRLGTQVKLTGETDRSGYIFFNNLPAGTYRLAETETSDPKYELARARDVVINRHGATVVATVPNYEIGKGGVIEADILPEGPTPRGGEDFPIGTYMLSGSMLAAAGVLLLLARRRRQRNEHV